MLVSFDGRMGQGKTAAATGLAIAEHLLKGVRLFTTYHLNDVVHCPHCPPIPRGKTSLTIKHPIHALPTADSPTPDSPLYAYQCGEILRAVKAENTIDHIAYTYLNLQDFYNIFKAADQGSTTLSNCIFVLDESYLFMDARNSSSKINRLFNSFVFQTRKRGVDMFITTHELARLDKRIRQGIDLRISCRYNGLTQTITLRIRDMHTGERRRLYLYGPSTSFPYFDTTELVRPQGKIYKMSAEELA